MLLHGRVIADKIKEDLKKKVIKYFPNNDKYLAILFFWDNTSSKIYVKHKQKYWSDIWLKTIIYWQDDWKKWNKEEIIGLINNLNNDESCVWIIVQLPLPDDLKHLKNEIVSAIDSAKDVDGLWGTMVWKSFFDMVSFCPATPKAVMTLLDYYNLWEIRNKKVAIIWQSTIVWKPLAIECLKRWAQIACFDINNTVEEIKDYCKTADYIFSATWYIYLVDETFVSDKKNQIIVDIGYGHKDGKPVGDVDIKKIEDKVLHVTPVPWGVGPLTIASLFSNIFDLWEQFH